MNEIIDKNILENMPYMAMWAKDCKHNFNYMNGNCAQLFGFGHPDESIGKRDEDIPCGLSKMADLFRKYDRMVMDNKKTLTLLEIQPCANQEWKVLYVTKIPWFHDKNLKGTIGYCIDITSCYHRFNFPDTKNKEDLYLTKRQSECLFLLLRGKTHKQIASILDLSPRTIEIFVKQLKQKFNCFSKSHLLEVAINQGFLNQIPSESFRQQLSIILKN